MGGRSVKTLPPIRKPKHYRPAKWVARMLADADRLHDEGYSVGTKKYPIGQSVSAMAMRLRRRHTAYEFAVRSGLIYCRRKQGAKS